MYRECFMMQRLPRWGIIALLLLAVVGIIPAGQRLATAQADDGDYDSSPAPSATLVFGGVNVNGGLGTVLLNISNNGSATEPLHISDYSIQGSDLGDFSIVEGSIPGGGITLAPGAGVTLTVRCNPSKTGVLSANLIIDHSDDEEGGSEVYPLDCTGLGPSYSSS